MVLFVSASPYVATSPIHAERCSSRVCISTKRVSGLFGQGQNRVFGVLDGVSVILVGQKPENAYFDRQATLLSDTGVGMDRIDIFHYRANCESNVGVSSEK